MIVLRVEKGHDPSKLVITFQVLMMWLRGLIEVKNLIFLDSKLIDAFRV
jgi:hypothetical protein